MQRAPRLLLVQADAAVRESDRLLFEGSEMVVAVADSLEQATERLALLPDLVLIDQVLPDGDGLSLLARLKASADEFVPVIVSNTGGAAERVAALQAGADESISRPCDPSELLARVRALLRLKSTHDRIRSVQLELQRLVISDPLTGLYNRRALLDRLTQEFERVERHGSTVALAMLDLDAFKAINDQHGHLFGDQVLRAVGEAILGSVRALDIPARFGGDEFAVVLPHTDPAGALRVCERLLKNISALEPRHGEASATITVSLGLAFVPSEGIDTPEDLLRLADDALYRAKRSGKNRICAVSAVPKVEQPAPGRTA